jgi:two-component sensor histidine kinase
MQSASDRVLTMGRVHEIGSHRVAGNLAEVIRGVCSDLVGPDPRFELKIDVDLVVVPAQQAAAVALIVNELVTNAVKHAFRDGAAGTIAVSLRQTEGNLVTLSVTDDGVPLPVNGQTGSPGIGLNLVARLANQLAGTLSVEDKPKRFSVVFVAHTVQRSGSAAGRSLN